MIKGFMSQNGMYRSFFFSSFPRTGQIFILRLVFVCMLRSLKTFTDRCARTYGNIFLAIAAIVEKKRSSVSIIAVIVDQIEITLRTLKQSLR